MKLTELLAIYTNAESTDEQKQAALAAYEEANKPTEQDTTELDLLKESIAKLEGKNAELLQEKKTAKQQAEEVTRKLEDAARKKMSSDQLLEDYNNRLAAETSRIEAEFNERLKAESDKRERAESELRSDRVDRRAFEIASDLSDFPEAILPHIKSRIGFEVNDNSYEDYVIDAQGKRTAATYDELKTEIANIPFLAHSIKSDFSNKGTQETRTEPVDKKSSEYKQGDSLSYLQSVANSVGE